MEQNAWMIFQIARGHWGTFVRPGLSLVAFNG